jgi:hypothetical protein
MRGDLDLTGYSGKGYAQKNPKLRRAELEANDPMLFRDWEDSLKEKQNTIYSERRNKKMSIKDWKNKELSENLNKKWGFKMDLDKLSTKNEKEYILEENQDRIFAPNHYCAHHVVYEGKEGFTIDHNWNEKLNKVTKYDVKFLDGTITRNIHESKLLVLEAFTEKAHKRDDHPKVKKDEDEKEVVSEEELEEAQKPDFPDIDGDGDREEPISKAHKDKKAKGKKKVEEMSTAANVQGHVDSRKDKRGSK